MSRQRSATSSNHARRRLGKGGIALRLFDPRRGDVALRVEHVEDLAAAFAQPQRCNYFMVLLIEDGGGSFHADLREVPCSAPSLLFFNPYQTLFAGSGSACRGVVLQFHANFFCIETHHQAVGCNGVLFNNLYGCPLVALDAAQAAEFGQLLRQMEEELRGGSLAHGEALVSILKLFLIKATRLKLEQQRHEVSDAPARIPGVLERLIEIIEQNYRQRHDPGHYAAEIHLTAKTLGRMVKTHFGRTLTDLIRERLMKEAKWLLLHTDKSVKEIAFEAGFADEYYFSRVFKRATGTTPTAFRAFETAIRAAGS